MLWNLKNAAAILAILLLLPYLAVTFSGTAGADAGPEPNLETYVCGVTAAVLPADCEDEFIKAQMILIRTNAVRKLQELSEAPEAALMFVKELGEPFREPMMVEKLFGHRLYQLAEDTRGLILTFEGEPIEGAYHAVSNGRTREGREVLGKEVSYLTSAACPEDMKAADYFCRIEFKEEEWRLLLEDGGEKWPEVEILERDGAGYVRLVRIGEEILTGEQFRQKLGLSSSDFIIEKIENARVVTTNGRGHGLGMSQYTANCMARDGKNHKQILESFFSGTELRKIE